MRYLILLALICSCTPSIDKVTGPAIEHTEKKVCELTNGVWKDGECYEKEPDTVYVIGGAES